MYDSFESIRADIDRRLADAAANWRLPMHTPVVATDDADLRIMVLRAWDAETRTLRFNTDARAPKTGIIGSGRPVGVLFYDKGEKIQIRCKGTGRIERDGAQVDAAWAESTNFARRCYLGDGPGSAADGPTSGLPAEFEGVEPDDTHLLPARQNFAILLVEVDSFDWFHLAHTGHRRAIFDRAGARWVSP